MINITIAKDKVVRAQNNSTIFEGENLIDVIHINICKIIGNVDISGFSFLFDYINVNDVGDSIQLNGYAVDSIRDDFLAFEIPVTNEITSLIGKIKYWIRIIGATSGLIAKTAEREITIFDHTSITDFIPVQSLTLLDQWQIYMDNTLAETKSIKASIITEENQRVSNEDDRITAENARKVFETYNNVKAYIVGNKVLYNGSSYSCILNTTDNLPTNETYWLLISQKGDMGNVMYATFDYDAVSGDIIMHTPDEFSGATFLMNEDGEMVVRVGV